MGLMRGRLGVFSGFGDSHNEIVSQVLVPYSRQQMPLQGAFLVVGYDDLLGRPSGLLGRVTRATPIGDLFTAAGEDYLVDLVRLDHAVPEEVKTGRLRYRISLRLLGQISMGDGGRLEYSPAIRQLPHVGADVGLPTEEVTQFIARGCAAPGEDPGPVIGHLAVGDLVFDGGDRAKGRTIPVHFRMDSLIGRRTAVFARAGMGKSNFAKVLLTRLYSSLAEGIPGTLVIDPEGEYAFSNASEPGLLDVPGLGNRVVVYTERDDFDPRYRARVLGDCMVDFAELDPVEAVNNLLPPEKQNMVFANLLRSLQQDQWRNLVKALEKGRYRTSHNEVARIVGKQASGEVDVVSGAIVNNLVPAIDRLHSAKSKLITNVKKALHDGKIVILDVSMLAGRDAKLIASWILKDIFANNQEAYTTVRHQEGSGAAAKRLIPCLAVFEEAQFYLGDEKLREDSAFVRWFKEGRKFKLGSILVTQQPGAIGPELISQCDNFFVFHLLSQHDLNALAIANTHYAGDVATLIGHEPIPGNCYLWSGRGLSFVTCARILHFGQLVGQEERRREPLEVVARAVAEPGPGVQLPVKQIRVGGDGGAGDYPTRLLRRVLQARAAVFLFRVRFADKELAAAPPCLSVVTSYLMQHVTPAMREDAEKGECPADIAKRLPLSAASFAELLAGVGATPRPVVYRDEGGKEHLAFYVTAVKGIGREPKGNALLK